MITGIPTNSKLWKLLNFENDPANYYSNDTHNIIETFNNSSNMVGNTTTIKDNNGGNNMWQLIVPALSMGLSYLNQSSQERREQEYIDKRNAQLEEAKITGTEKENMIDRVEDYYNGLGMSFANKQAMGLSKVLNSSTLSALYNSNFLGQRAKSLMETENKIMDYNNSLTLQQAGAPMNQGINFGDIISSGYLGFKIGSDIDELTA